MVKVQCILDYNDLQLKRLVKAGEELEVTNDRAKTLENLNLVKVLEAIQEPVKEPVVEEIIVEEKAPEPKKQVAKKQNKRK